MIENSIEASHIMTPSFQFPATSTLLLKQVLYIQYLVQFKKNQSKVQALLDSGNKVNTMTLAYATSLDFKICSIGIKAKKSNSFIFKTF